MNKYIINEGGKCWERISKGQARSLHNKGLDLLVTACNMHPFGLMGGVKLNGQRGGRDFDTWVNEFEYYNCSYECGKYAAFWKEV